MNKDHLNQTDEMIEKFIEECEKEAAALEITVAVSYTHLTLPPTPYV